MVRLAKVKVPRAPSCPKGQIYFPKKGCIPTLKVPSSAIPTPPLRSPLVGPNAPIGSGAKQSPELVGVSGVLRGTLAGPGLFGLSPEYK